MTGSSWLLSERFAVYMRQRAFGVSHVVRGSRSSRASSMWLQRTHCSLQSLYALFATLSAFATLSYASSFVYSLEKVRTHCPLATIALQTSYAPICRFLARIKVLAVCLAVPISSAMGPVCARSGRRTCRTWWQWIRSTRPSPQPSVQACYSS